MGAERQSFLLRAAAEEGKTACVETLLRHSVDPCLPSDRGATPLMLAAKTGQLDIVKMLLAYGADTNAKDKHGRRAVAFASRNGHEDVLQALVSHQPASTSNPPTADIDRVPVERASSMDGATAGVADDSAPRIVCSALVMLMEAACAGDEAKVDELLTSSPELDVNALHEGKTALMRAIGAGHVGVVRKLLVLHRADPNVMSTEGERCTCLMMAAGRGKDELLLLLIDHGANVHAKDVHGCTAVMHAIARGDAAAIRCLEALKGHRADLMATNNKGVSALMMAACAGKMAAVRYLLSQGADPTAKDGDGNDAIAWAEQGEGNGEVVAVLTEAVKAPVGMLIMAACRGDEAKVDRLLRSFPELNVNAVQDGHTALILAVFRERAGVVRQLLVEYNADPNVTWPEGWKGCTCLMHAAGNGDEEVVRLLLEHGANVHAKDAFGRTAVIRALESLDVVSVPCLELLKAHGADLTAANDVGATALRKAASEGQMEVVQYLLAHGADPTARDEQGRDAIACAKATSEGREVVGVLTKAANEHMERLAAHIEGQANGQAQLQKDKSRKKKHRRKSKKGEGVAVASNAQAGGGCGAVDVNVDAADVAVEGNGDGDEEQQLQQVTAAVAVASLHEGEVEPAAEEAEAQDTATTVAVPADTNEIEEEAPPVELTEEDFDDAPTLFECPISHTIMRDPVTAQDGYSYERSHIETWIRKAAEDDVALRSPMTNEAMDAVLIRNLVLKFMVDEYMQRKLTEKKARLAAVAANP